MKPFSVGFARYMNVVHDVTMPPDQFHHCAVIISITLAAILCSTLLIVTMTFERLYSIIMPHRAASFNTVNRAKAIILSIILLSIIFNIPQLFTSTNFGQLCVSFGTGSERTEVKIYYWLTFIIAGSLESAYSLIWGSHKIWGKGGGDTLDLL